MSTDQLTHELLSLPVQERVALAQALWESLGAEAPHDTADMEREAIAQARQRDAELTSGTAPARSHEEVMETVRAALACE